MSEHQNLNVGQVLGLRTLIGAILLPSIFVSMRYFVTQIGPRIVDDGVPYSIGPTSIIELILWGLAILLVSLAMCFIWASILTLIKSEKAWLNFVLAVIVAMLASVPSILSVPSFVLEHNKSHPDIFWAMLLLLMSWPVALLVASAATWWIAYQFVSSKSK